MKRPAQFILPAIVALGVLCALLWGMVYGLIFRDLPEIYALDDYRPNLITRIEAVDGSLVGQLALERRLIVPIEEVPDYLVHAFIAAEDDAFYTHEGLHYPSILRAAWANVKAGGVAQGGSTITQQVAKTFLLSSERTFVRKIKDMVLARRIEQHLQKNQILYLYLNQIYLGSGAYGVEAAARTYFDKSVGDLTLAQAALIAGLVPAPSRYTPRNEPELARRRQQFVLRRMMEQDFITPEQREEALAEEIVVTRPPESELARAVAYFNEEVRRYLVARYGDEEVLTGGLTVRTTMDPEAQLAAYQSVRQGLRDHDRRTGYRGPIRLAPEEDWPRLLEEIAEANAEVNERVGQVIQGLVVELDDEEEIARILLGDGRETWLTLEEVDWAHDPDPEIDGAYYKVKKVSRALRKGYQVRLERIGDREGEIDPETGKTLPIPHYALYQEPLAEGALFSMRVANGYVEAVIGGYSFGRSQFDRAVQMLRQPGSAFKPIVYATALHKGYTPASIVYDTPIVWRDSETGATWKPGNYSEKFYGPIPLRSALAKSRNIATIKVLRDIGIRPVIEMAESLGIEQRLEANLALGLGASEVTLAELVRAYTTFPAGGRRVEPIFILEIRDRDGKLLEENVPLFRALSISDEEEEEPETAAEHAELGNGHEPVPAEELEEPDSADPLIQQIRNDAEQEPPEERLPPGYGLDPITAYLMTDMLRAVVLEGTGRRAQALGRPTGGKTGTTNDLKDAWYVGFTPEVVTGVWVGYDTARNLGKNETGSRAAAPIFVDYAREVLGAQPARDFAVPEGIVFARIDRKTGKIACPGDGDAVFQSFREGTVPIERAACYGGASNGGTSFRPRMD